MKVVISELRERVNNFHEGSSVHELGFQVNEALNELELHRATRRNFDTQLEANNAQLRADLARITEIKDRQIEELRELRLQVDYYQEERANCDCHPLNNLYEGSPFAVWFAQHHQETIESITFNLRKKEN